MNIECYDKTGAEVYELVVRQTLQDLQITRAIKDLRVYADPREPLFIIAVSYEKTAPPIHMDDFTEYKYDEKANETFIRINDEKYLPDLLAKLGEAEGRNKIHQTNRYEIVIDDPQTDLGSLIIYDPEEDLRKKIYDALFRIIPEGFRIIQHYSKGNIIALTASDDVIQDEWLKKTDNIIRELKN